MRIGAVRRFNRFFTRRIGVLREGLLHTPYSLTEARVLFEIAYREQLTASYLSRELGLDPGYLSRIVARLEQQGLIKKNVRRSTLAGAFFPSPPRARAPSPCLIHARARRWARCSRSSPKGTSGVC